MLKNKMKFSDIPIRSYFYDWSHSQEWMLKIDDVTAMWEDGLQAHIDPDSLVEVTVIKKCI